MKLQAGLYATVLVILALPGLVSGTSISSHVTSTTSRPSPTPSSTGRGHWEFNLYKNKRCSGPPGNFKGNGSSGCHRDVPSGGVRGYSVKTIDKDCTVTMYKDQACSHGKNIAIIFSSNGSNCNPVGGSKKALGFKVNCWSP